MSIPIARISHYRIVSLLGRGGMGEVFRAVDERLGREVALKLLPGGTDASTDRQTRFLREAKAAGSLNHPGIVTVYDVGLWQGRLFLVMELIDGDRFTEVAARGVTVADALAMCADAADALATAHERGIMHRDVKSDNLMRTRDGRVKVLDFGLAKLELERRASRQHSVVGAAPLSDTLSPAPPSEALAHTLDSTPQITAPAAAALEPTLDSGDARPLSATPSLVGELAANPDAKTDSGLTQVGALLGTPSYMAPEQVGGRHAGAPSEVFSLGVVLHELIFGSRPFERASVAETLEAVRRAELTLPARTRAGEAVGKAATAVLARALDRDPDRRWPDMRAFAAAARSAAASGGRPARRRRAIYAAAATLGLGCAIAFAAARLSRRSAASEPPPPTVQSSRRITFDPGCEEYPSFLPDGKSLIFDGLIDNDYEIQRFDLATGERRRLTNAPSWDYAASVAPDGKSLAWIHLGAIGVDLLVARLDDTGLGAPTNLGGATGLPAWDTEGAVLHNSADSQIARWRFTDGAAHPEAPVPLHGLLTRIMVAFPGGRLVGLIKHNREEPDGVIAEIFPDGRQRVLLLDERSDQGGMAAGASQRTLYFAHPATSEGNELRRRALDGDAPPTVVPGGITPLTGLAISRDGHHLAYSTCEDAYSVVRLRGEAPPIDLVPHGRWQDRHPVRVDDHRMLLSSNRSGSDQIWIYDLRTKQARALTGSDGRDGSVSHDGKSLVYSDHPRAGLFILSLEGGALRRLTDEISDATPFFTHDDTHVVFTRGKDGPRTLVVAAAGGAARALYAAKMELAIPFPLDDRLLLTERAGPTMNRLLVSDLAGAPPKPLRTPLPPSLYNYPSFSPDGTHVLVTRNRTEVLELELASAAPPRVLWKAGNDALYGVAYAPDGDGVVASLATWDGDLWLVDGDFP